MDVKNIEKFSEFESYKEEWIKILKENNNWNPFLEWDWISRWWEQFGSNKKLMMLILYDNQEIVGFGPLMIEKKKGIQHIYFIGCKEAYFMDFLIYPTYRQQGLENMIRFLSRLKGIYQIHLQGVEFSKIEVQKIQMTLNQCRVPLKIKKSASRRIEIQNYDFETYFREILKHRNIKNIQSYEKKLNRIGEIVIQEVPIERIDEIFEIHNKRWHDRYDGSNFTQDKQKKFFTNLLIEKQMAFKAYVYGLFLYDRLIAYQYILEYKDVIFLYRISMNTDFSRFGPGKVMIKETLKKSCDKKINKFNMGYSDSEYKSKWTKHVQEIFQFDFCTNNWVSKVLLYLAFLKDRVKDFAIKRPKLLNLRTRTFEQLKGHLSIQSFKRKILRVKRQLVFHGFSKMIDRFLFSTFLSKIQSKPQTKLEVNLSMVTTSYQTEIFLEGNAKNLDQIIEITHEAPDKILHRFVNKHRFFYYLEQGKILFYTWTAELEDTKEGKCYSLYDHHIHKKYQYRWGDMINTVLAMLKLENVKTCQIYNPMKNTKTNHPSIMSLSKGGAI